MDLEELTDLICRNLFRPETAELLISGDHPTGFAEVSYQDVVDAAQVVIDKCLKPKILGTTN